MLMCSKYDEEVFPKTFLKSQFCLNRDQKLQRRSFHISTLIVKLKSIKIDNLIYLNKQD